MKKFLRIAFALILSLIALAIVTVAVTFPPVMSGMAAKTMCSCVYVTGRTPESVRQKELQVFPGLPDTDITMNDADSSVTASVFWKTSKAIYRKGVGCTLLSERSEEEVRNQKIAFRKVSLPVYVGKKNSSVSHTWLQAQFFGNFLHFADAGE